jgi:hypothetical protein
MIPQPSLLGARKYRRRVLKGATILLGIKHSEISCTIRNMHEDGAELRLPPSTVVPENFLLYVPTDGVGYRASLRWRVGDRIGVQFLGKEPKPSWHYGM